MADVTGLKNNLTRAQYIYDGFNEQFNGQWGPANALERYEVGSPQYEAALKEYKKLKPQFEKAKADLDAAKQAYEVAVAKSKAEQKKKEARKSTGGKLDKAKKDYQRALDTEDPERIKTAKEALDAARGAYQSASNPEPEQSEEPGIKPGPTTLDQDKYSEYTYLDGKVTNSQGREVIFVDVVNSDGTVTQKEYTTRAQAREAFLAQYKKPGQLDKLKQDLLAANYIKQKQIVDGTWVDELDRVLIDRTRNVVREVKYGSGKAFSVDEFIKSGRYSDGTKKPIVYTSQSTRGDARLQIDTYLTDLRGTPATEEEYESYYKQLRAEELKQTSMSKDGATIGSVMTDAERVLIAAKVARNSLRNTNVETLLGSSKGSQLAMDISALQEVAADYGIEMSAAEALKQVTNGIGQRDYLEKQKERLKLIAKQVHPTLAAHIDAGGTVLDIANVYAQRKAAKLGVIVKTPTKDKDVMDAVTSNKSIPQFEREMQANPLWRYTDEARETAADFISTIGRMWGRG